MGEGEVRLEVLNPIWALHGMVRAFFWSELGRSGRLKTDHGNKME